MNRYRLCRRCIRLFSLALMLTAAPIAVSAADRYVVVGTYQYPDIDRRGAVRLLADLAADISGKPAVIRVASTPAELAAWVMAGDVQIAVPNLVAYLEMKAGSDSIVELAVPAAGGSTTYSSSVIVASASPLARLADLRSAEKPIALIMVWPDSASGALVAGARLRHEMGHEEGDDFAPAAREYAGSHQNVLRETAGRPGAVGVLATKVYLDHVASAALPSVREIWRSGPIPFGPLVCRSTVGALCDTLQRRLLRQSAESAAILGALKDGWPEFAGASSFERPLASRYDTLIEAYASLADGGR